MGEIFKNNTLIMDKFQNGDNVFVTQRSWNVDLNNISW
jgi:hypothetical protein